MALNKANSVAIDIEGLVASIKARMYQDLFISSNCFIFKTPTILGRINEKAYVPEAYSIWPFHHGCPELKEVEKKIKCKKNKRYARPIGYSPDEFVRILLIRSFREKNDLIFTMACMFSFLLHDLILLENQVPWMVRDHLFNMTMDPTHNEPLIELSLFMATLLSKIAHIIDVCRKLMVSSIIGEKGQLDWTLPSATRLVEAGVKIKKGEFTSYAILLDKLINTAKDLDILCENKVIDNWLSPNDAVLFFNKLYYNTHLKKEIYYQKLCKDVNEYCNSRWLRWRNYFNTPWAILSTTAIAILFILPFLQTWFTIY
ncbi:hypothetical protein RGQ29_012041 [Quercus rubra]|uniref:Uncharacterized protein n=1 Tax=Quercus rubra TaxID=3512 RepID=A0AAN7FYR1_QUERU|nr:hypothetical protein RGQ29_012041 [Quercus rubra]